MNFIKLSFFVLISLIVAHSPASSNDSELLLPGETHLQNIRQLTFEGENAEGYFHPDGEHLILQSTPEKGGCDQIYLMDIKTGKKRMVSTGDGVTTCSFFIPGTEDFIYASTHR